MMRVFTPEEAAYLAGFIDGEGSLQVQFRLHTNKFGTWKGYSIYLEVANTNKEVIEYLNGIGGAMRLKPAKDNRKDAWIWHLCGVKAQDMVRQIYPYLRVKKAIADVFLKFPMYGNMRTEETAQLKHNLYEEAKKLNHRGTSFQRFNDYVRTSRREDIVWSA